MSALAVLSLVLALLLGVVAIAGFWWVEAVPLVLGIAALGATGPGRKRGRGVAIAAIVLAGAGGAFSFLSHRALERAIEDHLGGLIGALDRGERAKAEEWRLAPAEGATAPDVGPWVARAAVARERLGPHLGETTVGSVWLGFMVALVHPEGVEEVDPRGAKPLGLGEALWARVAYEKGTAWFAFVGRETGTPGSALEDLRGLGEDGKAHPWVRDVRVYLDRAAAPER
jgi:hypothetical protein